MDKMNISKQTALKFVILLGIVSLFGDMTYEGAQHHRSLPGRAEGQRHRGGRCGHIGGLVSPDKRGTTAHGLLNSGYGLAWFLGSVLLGVLYDISLPAQLAAVPLLWWIGKQQ